MAAMTTALTVFSDEGSTRRYKHPNHTIQKPKLITQKRKEAVGTSGVAQDEVTISYGTLDVDGNIIPSKVTFGWFCRRPVNMNPAATEVTDAFALFREIVASDEAAAVVSGQTFIKS